VPGIGEKSKAQMLVGKKVSYTTKSGKVLKGVITRPHGGNGLVRARFTKGLPGQAIGKEAVIAEKIVATPVKKAPAKKAPAKKPIKKVAKKVPVKKPAKKK